MEIDLGRLNALVAEPQCDHGSINARLQEPHRCGVPQHVRRDPLGAQGRARARGSASVLGQQTLDRVTAEGTRSVRSNCDGVLPSWAVVKASSSRKVSR